jgi:hypothetical protein
MYVIKLEIVFHANHLLPDVGQGTRFAQIRELLCRRKGITRPPRLEILHNQKTDSLSTLYKPADFQLSTFRRVCSIAFLERLFLQNHWGLYRGGHSCTSPIAYLLDEGKNGSTERAMRTASFDTLTQTKGSIHA